MSMKRTRQKTYSSTRRVSDNPSGSLGKTAAEPDKTWEEHMEGQPEDAFLPYSLKAKYDRGAFLAHPKFGKGIVVGVEATRIEVLFADGKKKLGHGLT
jgi:hypothetical protein